MANGPRILLVGPTALDFHGKPIKQRRLYLPGLTLPMLAAVTPENVDLHFCYDSVEEVPYHEHWDLVGLTGMGSGIVRAWQIADRFREQGVPVVQGGIATSLAGAEMALEHADHVVTGEGEDVWPQVVQDLLDGTLKPHYQAPCQTEISSLPAPRYDLLHRRKLGFWRPVQATRGCPFTCNFCSVTSFFEQSYRKRPVDQVIRDVRLAKAHGTRYIAFIDDNIAVDWKYFAELCTALIPEKISWISQCSLHIATRPDMLELARDSGCKLLSFGVESVSPESLAWVDKSWNNPARYSEAFARIRRYGIEVSTEMIIGLDGDDRTVFQRTYDFIMDHRVTVPRVHIMTPVPGTPLFDQMDAEGRIETREFGRYSGGQVVFRPKAMTSTELQDGYWKLYEALFTPRAIAHRMMRSSVPMDALFRAFLWGVNLHYRRHIHHRITPGIV